jgi:hypothetical protein
VALHKQLLDLAGDGAELCDHREAPWASITFEGSRHKLRVLFSGDQAEAASARFIAALREHEFAIPGHVIAEATTGEAEWYSGVDAIVPVELLLLKEA